LPDGRLSAVVVDSSLALIVHPASQWNSLGLHSGDLLVDINASRPRTSSELFALMHRLRIGDSLTISVRRGDVSLRFA
jgi:type II secretory pathway component PulC